MAEAYQQVEPWLVMVTTSTFIVPEDCLRSAQDTQGLSVDMFISTNPTSTVTSVAG